MHYIWLKVCGHPKNVVAVPGRVGLEREGSLYLACNDKNALFLLLNNLNDINCGHVRKCVMRSIIFWTIYLSRAMGKCVFGVNLAILRFCDFYTGHYMKSKLVFV